VWANRPGGGEPDSPGWLQRSVPNLYPVLGEGDEEALVGAESSERESALSGEAGQTRRSSLESGFAASIDPLGASTRTAPDLFRSQPAEGAHEVIVHTPEHVTTLAALSEEQLEGAVAAWRTRMSAHAADAALVHVIVNEGPDAGASLEHSHAQLYALGFVPAEIARERERAAAYNERTMGSHLLADVATQEVRRRERLVAIDDDAILLCPWASRSPFQLRIVPRRPAPSFEADEAGIGMLRTAVGAMADAFATPPQLNLWVRTAPRGTEEFCWHIDIVPRLTVRAGFELGTGVDVNIYPPERAASDLREVLG
jgi:UDPglucose--hexose-1-phosphate uridylyltransferase